MKFENLHIKIDKRTKELANKKATSLGLNMSQYIRMLILTENKIDNLIDVDGVM